MRRALKSKLEQQGALLTQQRTAVYEYLHRAVHHPSAEDVFLAVKAQLPKLSLATVYKNLEALVACGAASKLTYGDAAARYDIRTDHHYHARCLQCGRITDVEPAAQAALGDDIKAPRGFRVEDYRVELLGRCRQCQ
ncbi:MAG: transcriptional repressor [Acidobacteria bacterium]|nr:transcriptional repressor [Acidobacteriota bacterium]MBI3425170.1 transcriptional repressor [Acidobacteriota bacterium]